MHKILRTTVVGVSTWMHTALLGSLVPRPRPHFLSPNPNLNPAFPYCKQQKAGQGLHGNKATFWVYQFLPLSDCTFEKRTDKPSWLLLREVQLFK